MPTVECFVVVVFIFFFFFFFFCVYFVVVVIVFVFISGITVAIMNLLRRITSSNVFSKVPFLGNSGTSRIPRNCIVERVISVQDKFLHVYLIWHIWFDLRVFLFLDFYSPVNNRRLCRASR